MALLLISTKLLKDSKAMQHDCMLAAKCQTQPQASPGWSKKVMFVKLDKRILIPPKTGLTDDAAGQETLLLGGAGQEGCVGASIAHGHAKALG